VAVEVRRAAKTPGELYGRTLVVIAAEFVGDGMASMTSC
jgi:hypothetical protein